MPTTIYTKHPISSVSHAGKQYDVEDGQVDVPDEAVPAFVESHGFSLKPVAAAEDDSADDAEQKPVNKGGRPSSKKKAAAAEDDSE